MNLAPLLVGLTLAASPAGSKDSSCDGLKAVKEWSGTFTFTLDAIDRTVDPRTKMTIVDRFKWSAGGPVRVAAVVEDGAPRSGAWRGTEQDFSGSMWEQTSYENVRPEGEHVMTKEAGELVKNKHLATLTLNCAERTYRFGIKVGDLRVDRHMELAPALKANCAEIYAKAKASGGDLGSLAALPCAMVDGSKAKFEKEKESFSFSARAEDVQLPPGAQVLQGSQRVKTNHGRFEGKGILGELTWTLHPGPPAKTEPRLEVRALDGKRCGCNGQPIELTASASEPGGSFDPFVVRSTGGAAPTVSQNRGGASPRLSLQGPGKTTGRVEVVARYRKGGKVTDSAPFSVSFGDVERPELPSNAYAKPGADGPTRRRYVFGTDAPASLEIDALSRAWLDGADASDQLVWHVSGNDDGWFKGRDGRGTTLRASGLPGSNGRLGPHGIWASVERCACEGEKAEAVLFFPVDRGTTPSDFEARRWATNNPAGDPNWTHYWAQTSAGRASGGGLFTFQYVDRIAAAKTADIVAEAFTKGSYKVQARYEPDLEAVLLSHLAESWPCAARPNGAQDLHLDCFAVLLRHEACHGRKYRERKTFCAGKTGCAPELMEQNEEPTCYAEGWSWGPGSGDGEDWSDVGKAWLKP